MAEECDLSGLIARSIKDGLVLCDAIFMIAAGTMVALPCVWGLGRLVQSQLYEVKPADPITIGAASLGGRVWAT